MGAKTTALVTFKECVHTSIFDVPAPRIGETIFCVKCRKYQTVATAPPEWRIRCLGCTYARASGTDRHLSNIAVAKHRMKYPAHIVRLYNGFELVQTIGDCNQIVMSSSPDLDQISLIFD